MNENKRALTKQEVMSLVRYFAVVILVFAAMVAYSVSASRREETTSFFAMDTFMTVTAYGKNTKSEVYEASHRIMDLSELLDVTEPDSELSLYNHGASDFLSEEAEALLVAAELPSELTDGAFDVTLYSLMAAWGFYDGNYRVPDKAEIEALLAEDKSIYDFGGIAKGYAADVAAEVMRRFKVRSALITLGGNIYAIGKNINGKPWRIAIQDPFDLEGFAGILSLKDTSTVTSGAYQRFFEQDGKTYHHILDPRTGYPADSGLASVTVVSKNSALADGLSTGLFVLGQDNALEIWRENKELFDLVLIADNGDITITAGLDGKFESKNDYTVAE